MLIGFLIVEEKKKVGKIKWNWNGFSCFQSSDALFVLPSTVSQFTLYGFLKGNKPDFHVAMPPQKAKPFYASLIDRFRNAYNSDAIKGKFQLYFLRWKGYMHEKDAVACFFWFSSLSWRIIVIDVLEYYALWEIDELPSFLDLTYF